jgi:hypothetical protein
MAEDAARELPNLPLEDALQVVHAVWPPGDWRDRLVEDPSPLTSPAGQLSASRYLGGADSSGFERTMQLPLAGPQSLCWGGNPPTGTEADDGTRTHDTWLGKSARGFSSIPVLPGSSSIEPGTASRSCSLARFRPPHRSRFVPSPRATAQPEAERSPTSSRRPRGRPRHDPARCSPCVSDAPMAMLRPRDRGRSIVSSASETPGRPLSSDHRGRVFWCLPLSLGLVFGRSLPC